MHFTLNSARQEAVERLRRIVNTSDDDEAAITAAGMLFLPDLDEVLADVPSFATDIPDDSAECDPSEDCPLCADEGGFEITTTDSVFDLLTGNPRGRLLTTTFIPLGVVSDVQN